MTPATPNALRREASTPASVGTRPDCTATLLLERAAAAPDAPLFARPTAQGWTDVGAADFLDEVRALARGLIAAGTGPGDRIAIMSASSYAWALADFAVWFAGGVTVPLDPSAPPEQITAVLSDARVRRVFVEDASLARAVDEAVAAAPALGDGWLPVTLMDDDAEGATLRSLAGPGLGVSDAELERHRSAARADSAATLVYPTGAERAGGPHEVTHGRLTGGALNLAALLPDVVGAGARTLLFLPLDQLLARTVQITCVAGGAVIGHCRAQERAADLAAFRPTFLLAVPRVLETGYATARARAGEGVRGAVFERAADTAREYSAALAAAAAGHGEGPGRRLRARHAVFDRLVYRALRAGFGGSLATVVSGPGSLDPGLIHFFRGAGIEVLEASRLGLLDDEGFLSVLGLADRQAAES
ncbi:AMP-binding protein [Sinomonas halotolerans]|uniref:AMP-binding protein n=1 Tax=Sinomonas halotolerans TaxID=1644133 RepID=A0ABU9WV05_9MICC